MNRTLVERPLATVESAGHREARVGAVGDHGDLPHDDAIVGRLRDGDEAAFAIVLDAWTRGMLRAARVYVATHDSAEDVVQDTWLAVIRGIHRFEGRSSLRTWVYRILINTAKTRGRKESRAVPVEGVRLDDTGPAVDPRLFRGHDDAYPGGWREFAAPWPSPESEVEAREVRRRIEQIVAGLPARQRIVITLRDVEGYAPEEVCDILAISPVNQRVLLHRARAAVRGRLADYFAEAAPSGGPR